MSGDSTLLFVSYRSPASLAVIDVSQDDSINPTDRLLAKVPIGSLPGDLKVARPFGGIPELVYISCFNDDRIDVVDPRAGAVVTSIPTGRGPFGLALIDTLDGTGDGMRRLYVTHFNEHTVGVIDLDPASPWYHQMIAEIR